MKSEPRGGRVAVAVFFAMMASMTTGGVWRALHLDGVDAVLAITFGVVFAGTLGAQHLRR